MALNIRRVGEVADNSVTASKLVDGAVDLGTAKVTGQAPATKIADSSITEAKLANLAVSTGKLQDNVITLAKAGDDIKLNTFTGDETEVSVTGITEEVKKEFQIPNVATKFVPKKLRLLASLKTSNVTHEASLKVYFNEEETPRATLTSTSLTYEFLNVDIDISNLSAGRHTAKIALVSADAAETASNDMIDAMLVR